MIGELIDGKYRVLRQLGQGGMGAVYEAEHVGTGGHVAVKVLTGADVVPNGIATQRFQREVRAAGGLDTKHIVKVFDAGIIPERGPYMVMEILRGDDLAHVLKRLRPLPPDLALRILGQACLGLLKAHDAGIVHRDIKPANLFLAQVDDEIVVKVLDFGIAKVESGAAREAPATLTETGHIIGSLEYMSPEQIKSTKSVDHRTDIWSLGVVLYEALAGRRPFADYASMHELIFSICMTHPPPLEEVAPWVPTEAVEIVRAALAHDANQRIQTVSAMLDAIRRLVPNGFNLRPEMLVTLTPEERGQVAPRLGSSQGTVELPTQRMPPSAARNEEPSSVAASNDRGAPSMAQVSGSKPPLAAALAIAAVLGLGGVGVALYKLGPHAGGEAATAMSSSPAASGSLVTPPATAAASPLAERSVRVAIEPATARVDVDDRPSDVKDGAVEIRGALGTVHRVRLRLGKSEAVTQVAIADSGALPPKVQLDAEPSKGAPRSKASAVAAALPAPAPSVAPKSAPPPPAPATAVPADGISKTFQP